MPIMQQIHKVLVIGSGPIVIGQAAEFDYSGTQACLTLKEAGCNVVLINNNPATIMTDEHVADRVYFEPLTVKNIEAIIAKERPDGLLATVSGQTGLNLAFQLAEKGVLDNYNVTVLGTPIEAIMRGEDRELFRNMMETLNEPIAESTIVSNVEDALAFSENIGYPIIVRPAYTLGGSGGGIATNKEDFITYVTRGLRASPIQQCLIERSIAGWKEIEFEVVCDRKQQAVVVCHMENIDPVGVHTGDSIVVAPIQTLPAEEVTRLKAAAVKIVKELGIIGACNVQLAYEPTTQDYVVIEVNPRVSRSSALASKATGYPIAKIATKLSLGMTLDELAFPKMNTTLATYEPQLDYVVVKFPSFPFTKLKAADRHLGTQMKATGEVMAIDKTIRAAMQKAVRSLEHNVDGLTLTELNEWTKEQLEQLLTKPDDRRFFAILELLRRGVSVEHIHDIAWIDPFFLEEMHTLVYLEQKLKSEWTFATITDEQLLELKQAGFTNTMLAKTWGVTLEALKEKLRQAGIAVTYERVLAYSAERTKDAAYYYATWKKQPAKVASGKKDKVLIIGSGPIQIGQGIEFDYCSVQGVKALQAQGYETVMINNNPATVSTDYEVADRLIFEPITAEDVLQVMEYEGIEQVIVQFGGQTSLNLVGELEAAGVRFFGTTQDTIDQLEDRDRFYQYLQSINVPHIPGLIAHSEDDLWKKVTELGYPILLRPSYVIGGKGMEVIEDAYALTKYIQEHLTTEKAYPILIDAYYPGKEVEIDAITDGEKIFIPAIFEHIEKAGVHSGDSMAVTPPVTLSDAMKKRIVDYAERIAKGLNFKGIFNIQYVIYEDELYVLEVNPRASRTVPVISKVTGVNMIEIATRTLLGETLAEIGEAKRLLPENKFYTVKAPVFSTHKLPGVDPQLVAEMKSTGELIAMAESLEESLTKAFLWNEDVKAAFARTEKEIFTPYAEAINGISEQLAKSGIQIKNDLALDDLAAIEEWMKSDTAFAIYLPNGKQKHLYAQYEHIRKRALEHQLIVFTAEETLAAFAQMTQKEPSVKALDEFQLAYERKVVLQ